MEEMKSCPYCGQEILANAKKCKHCGKWLEKQCPQCGEWVNAEAKKCRYCGYWFDAWQCRLQEKAEQEKRETQKGASVEEIKAAIEEEKENSNTGCILYVESIIIGALVGYIYDFEWWGYAVFLGVFSILLSIHFLRILYCIGISLVWGVVGIVLSPYLFDESELQIASRLLTDNYADYWWMGVICTIISLVFHQPAMHSRFNY